mmetsp:Transcript_39350/g.60151  ORF Transcript_39350/g.60151 Transcript_39350/m.60151 type:complete len:112 (-) Transcript_39350:713-1048(-)
MLTSFRGQLNLAENKLTSQLPGYKSEGRIKEAKDLLTGLLQDTLSFINERGLWMLQRLPLNYLSSLSTFSETHFPVYLSLISMTEEVEFLKNTTNTLNKNLDAKSKELADE